MTALNSVKVTVLTVVFCAVSSAAGAPAFADSPSTWDAGPSRTPLENVVFFGGSVVGLFILVTLFALIMSRNNFVPDPPEPGTDVEPHGHH